MYWCTFVSVFFLGVIQGFIFRDNQCSPIIPYLIGDSTKLYSNKFPWLDAIDGSDDDNRENNDDERGDDNNEKIMK